jgi:hypothetical protein
VKKLEVLLLLATLAACGGPDKPAARGAILGTDVLPLAIESRPRQAPPHSCPTGSIYSYVERVCLCPVGQIDTTHMKRDKFGVCRKQKLSADTSRSQGQTLPIFRR